MSDRAGRPDRPLRIAMFTETFLPNVDGVVTSIVNAREALQARGHRVAVFCPGERRRSEGDVHWFKARTFKAYPDYRMPIYRTEVGDLVEDFDPDVVHSHGTFFMGVRAVLAARKLDRPLVYTYHTNLHDAKHYVGVRLSDRALDRMIWTLLRWYLRRTDAVVAPSRATADLLRDKADDDIARLAVVPNGVDTDRFAPDAPPPADPELTGALKATARPRVLTVGRVAKEKGVDRIVRAAVRRPDLSFLVAGKGPYLDEVRRLAARLGASNVTFLGYVPDADLPGLLAACDVFLTGSTFETQGLAVVEAMAAGLPVVAPDIPVFREVVRPGESGVLADEPTGRGLARALDAALELEDADKAARAAAGPYDRARCADRLEAVYAEVLEAARAEVAAPLAEG